MIPCSSDAYIEFHLACTASGCTWRRSKPNENGGDVIVEEGRDTSVCACACICARGCRQVKYGGYVMRIPNIKNQRRPATAEKCCHSINSAFLASEAALREMQKSRYMREHGKQCCVCGRQVQLGTILWRIYSARGPRRAAIFPRSHYWSVKILIHLRIFWNVKTAWRREMELIGATATTAKHSRYKLS